MVSGAACYCNCIGQNNNLHAHLMFLGQPRSSDGREHRNVLFNGVIAKNKKKSFEFIHIVSTTAHSPTCDLGYISHTQLRWGGFIHTALKLRWNANLFPCTQSTTSRLQTYIYIYVHCISPWRSLSRKRKKQLSHGAATRVKQNLIAWQIDDAQAQHSKKKSTKKQTNSRKQYHTAHDEHSSSRSTEWR